ncbi:MAG: crossover junction endodeoxyribonuclease RuvC [Verrucomicrobiales bacterium]|nr:crossover junction endodeoxyribonuclease RuvC [Verrucomicrobiales bacterium]
MGITSQQLAAMQQRIASGKNAAQAEQAGKDGPQVILGIDPSLRGTGYGVIDTAPTTPATLSQGTLRCPADWPLSRCLRLISESLEAIVQETHPTIAAVEGLFHAQNVRTALVMSQARGAALAVLGRAELDVFEISPRKVKQAIVGYGAAQKEAVAKMVQTRLSLPELPEPDAADALAIAITCAQSLNSPIPDKAVKPL